MKEESVGYNYIGDERREVYFLFEGIVIIWLEVIIVNGNWGLILLDFLNFLDKLEFWIFEYSFLIIKCW